MKYDKKSFCAGIAVGTQLKGWASTGTAGGGGAGGEGGFGVLCAKEIELPTGVLISLPEIISALED